ncbi:MAG: hypothetical protein WCB49_13575 [Gammaproteobacteria bacterium]
MRTSIFSAIALAVLAASATASAASTSGHFYTHTTSRTKTVLANGNTSVLWSYYILQVTDNASAPMNNTAGNCTGNAIFDKQGKEIAGGGICFFKDEAGDSLPLTWSTDEAGTAKCPNGCGHFTMLPGTGKFKGMTGGGTFDETHLFGDHEGSSGTLKINYSK